MNDQRERSTKEHDRGDVDLERAFGALRSEEAGRLPAQAVLRARAESERAPLPDSSIDRRWRGWWWPAAAMAAVAVWLALPTGWTSDGDDPDLDFALGQAVVSLGAWVMPSDVLLDLSEIPGSDLMGEADWALPSGGSEEDRQEEASDGASRATDRAAPGWAKRTRRNREDGSSRAARVREKRRIG